MSLVINKLKFLYNSSFNFNLSEEKKNTVCKQLFIAFNLIILFMSVKHNCIKSK